MKVYELGGKVKNYGKRKALAAKVMLLTNKQGYAYDSIIPPPTHKMPRA